MERGDSERRGWRERNGAVEGLPAVPARVPPSPHLTWAPSPLTCLEQGASGTARRGYGVLPHLRQEQSQAAESLFHFLFGGHQ